MPPCRAPAAGVGPAPPPPALIVVPTYHEADNLEPLVAAVLRAAPDATRLVVDDASPDGTGRLADRLAGRAGAAGPRRKALKVRLGLA